MDLDLKNKIAIITGASRGIGKSIAQTLSAEGVKLTLVARSPLDEFSASLPTESLPLSIDLRQPDAASRVVEATLQKFGGIDILVNNAGATKRGDFLQLTDDEWTDGFALKFYGAMRLSRAAWTSLMQSKGSIVNIIGIGGR
ncbi:MAG TPA: SDR family NAD(P)-dependent oxidoreductase, partial [Anaerolineales bacterium]|nr:SDR family NAD(P)-dependent oxidoreductase [Anaerolineales bacterium]